MGMPHWPSAASNTTTIRTIDGFGNLSHPTYDTGLMRGKDMKNIKDQLMLQHRTVPKSPRYCKNTAVQDSLVIFAERSIHNSKKSRSLEEGEK